MLPCIPPGSIALRRHNGFQRQAEANLLRGEVLAQKLRDSLEDSSNSCAEALVSPGIKGVFSIGTVFA